jgi:hypothetical protein
MHGKIIAIIISLFSTALVSLDYPLQGTHGQTSSSNSTQLNTTSNITQLNDTSSESEIQWAVYANDNFGFSMEYPLSWIVSEKQNRFESGYDLTVEGPDRSDSNWGQFDFSGPEPAASNVRVLANLALKDIIGGFNVDNEYRLIEGVNMTRYKIGGETAGAFTYVVDSKDFVDGESITTPVDAAEAVVTNHDGKEY